jgi:hypothetical protein
MPAQVIESFQRLMENMQAFSANIATYLNDASVPRPWMHPPASTGEPLAIEDIKTGFDRSEANEQYASAIHNGGTMADCMTSKVQIDYCSVMERAYRHRHMTPVRAMMHASGRRQGHGNQAGLHIGGILQYVENLAKTSD